MLILGSYSFSYPITAGKLSDAVPNKQGKALIIPLASMYGFNAGVTEKKAMVSAGFIEENICVFDEAQPEELLKMRFDYISVLGGNTFKLLHDIRKYSLDSFIKEQYADGAVYLGFSAGAYLASPSIAHIRSFDDNNHIFDENYSALSLTEKHFLCHFDVRGAQEIKMCRDIIGYDVELVTIDNDQIIVIE